MRLYETTFILGPQADEATFDRQINAVSEVIKRYNGRIFDEDRIGIRRLAYPIKKYTQGYYARMVFTGDNSVLAELDRFYRLEEAYIRYLTVVFEGTLDEETGKVSKPMPKVKKHHESHGDDSEKDKEKTKDKAEARSEEKVETKVEDKAEDNPGVSYESEESGNGGEYKNDSDDKE